MVCAGSTGAVEVARVAVGMETTRAVKSMVATGAVETVGAQEAGAGSSMAASELAGAMEVTRTTEAMESVEVAGTVKACVAIEDRTEPPMATSRSAKAIDTV